MPAQKSVKGRPTWAWSIVENAPICVENVQLPVKKWWL
jgi:hypothetical protein